MSILLSQINKSQTLPSNSFEYYNEIIPARLKIMMILSSVEDVDFNFILKTLELTKGTFGMG